MSRTFFAVATRTTTQYTLKKFKMHVALKRTSKRQAVVWCVACAQPVLRGNTGCAQAMWCVTWQILKQTLI